MATTHLVDVQLRLMQTISGQLDGLSKQMGGMQRQADDLGKTMKLAFGFHELERFGKAGMSTFGGMIHQASNLQLSMSKVQIATSATSKEMKSLGDIIVDTSSKHAMSAMQAADMMAVVARTGMAKETIKATFPAISTFADIQKMERGMDFEQSAKMAATTARFFGARDPASTERVLNNLYKAMNTSPMAPNQLLTSLQNFAPVGQQLGMSQEDTFQAASLMGTMGLGSKGGTGLFNILLRSIGKTPSMTGHRESEQVKALRDLGLTQSIVAPGGKFDFAGMFGQLTKKEQEMSASGRSGQFIKDLIGAFNDRGGRVAAALATPEARDNMLEMISGWSKVTTMQDAYEIEQKNLTYQTSVLKTNFDNLRASMASGTIPTLSSLNKHLGDWVAQGDSYLKNHPTLQTGVGATVLAGEGLSSIAALIGKVGSGVTGFMALKAAFTGKSGMPVYVTNMPAGGGLGGVPGAPGLAGSALKVLGAAGAGVALGTAIDAGFTALVGKSIGEKLYDAVMGGHEKSKEREAQDMQWMKSDMLKQARHHGGEASMVIHGMEVHVHGVHDLASLEAELRKAGNRSSGSSTTGPMHSTSSGYGGSGGP